MRKKFTTGKIIKKAGAILCAVIMATATNVVPVKADEVSDYSVIAEGLEIKDGSNGGPSGGKIQKNPYGEDFISGCQFSIPSEMKEGLGGFDWLRLQVTATVKNYTPLTGENYDANGNPLTPIVYIYGMDSKYENWNQANYDLTQDPQTAEMELDLAPYIAEGTLGEIGMKVAGCEVGSSVEWEITSVRIIGEGESAEVEEVNIELKYEPSGTMKEIALESTEVGKHGKLHMADVDGYTAPVIVDKDNNPYQLLGVSTHGLSWFPQYVNKDAFQTFRDYWGVNLIRIAVYAHEGENAYVNQYAKELTETEGHDYIEGQNQKYNDKLIQEGVQAATDLGMYVIIDWHVLNYNPNEDLEDASAFFKKYAEMYKDYDNVIFEICNEPTGTEWFDGSDNDLYSYCTKLTNVIREYGSDAIVICGTDSYSSKVDEVAGHLLEDKNTIYTCHFYSASHYAEPMKKLTDALADGVPVIVSEYGVCTASGDGRYDVENADEWLNTCDKNNVSYACWAISNSYESAAYFQENLEKYDGNWIEDDLTTTSKYIINRYNDRKAELEGSQPTNETIEKEMIQTESENSQPTDETIGEEISQTEDHVNTPSEKTGKSPMVPTMIVLVVIALGAVVIVKVKGKTK
ncbi:MAG: glycoside hydrolase family 5 protein [Lachnospiraceae bacterium]|nr:glycoside hydrolase family 5 protein [Lachnospiraceae bacterium]MDE7202512.1 glycoside hydrolase family 5 protein [Lachnospiraceae bacterium]